MSPEAWYTIACVTLVMIALVTVRINVDTAMVGGLTLLLLGDAVLSPGNILPLEEGILGFAHPAVLMIGALFVVAAGLQETGGLEMLALRLLGRPRTTIGAQTRMMIPVAVLSGFMNNTPIVAMYLPIINDWARKLRLSPSKLYMPLSYSAILGGKLTLIGSGSNIFVMGMYVAWFTARMTSEQDGAAPAWLSTMSLAELSTRQQFWSIALLGVPTTIVGIALIVVLSRWLLPERRPATEDIPDARRYHVEMVVNDDAPISGRSIEEAGLRHLPGLYLSQIERGDQVIPAPAPEQVLEGGDRLAFAGILESVVDLRRIRGLVPATDQVHKISAARATRTLVEAVVGRGSALLGQTVRASQFRTKYNAAIIAVHRNGEQIQSKIGDIVLQSGDTLLLETHAGFVSVFRNSDEFYLVSQVEGSRPVRHERAGVALGILGLLVLMLTLTSIPPAVVALVCAGLMVTTRCVTGTEARKSVSWQILIVIGAGIGMGVAMRHTGAAQSIAHSLIELCTGFGPHLMLLTTFFIATLFAQVLTNYGSAAIMFPIVLATAEDLGVSPVPFVFTLIMGAGTIMLSPIGYQTNLMVFGPGGYRFLDYARLGLPITIAVGLICMWLAPIFYPFLPAS